MYYSGYNGYNGYNGDQQPQQQQPQQYTYDQLVSILLNYQEQIKSLTDSIEEFQKTNQDLFTQYSEMKKEKEVYQQQVIDLFEEKQKLESENEQMKPYYDDYDRLYHENEQLKQQAEEYQQITSQYNKLLRQHQYVERHNQSIQFPSSKKQSPKKQKPSIESFQHVAYSNDGKQFVPKDLLGNDDFIQNSLEYFQQQFHSDEFNIPLNYHIKLDKQFNKSNSLSLTKSKRQSQPSIIKYKEIFDNMKGNHPTMIIKVEETINGKNCVNVYVIFGSEELRPEKDSVISDDQFFIAQLMRNNKLLNQCYIKDEENKYAYDTTYVNKDDENCIVGIGYLFALTKVAKLEWENNIYKDDSWTIMENGNRITMQQFHPKEQKMNPNITRLVILEWEE